MRLNDSPDDEDNAEQYKTKNLAGGSAYEAATPKKRLTIVVINNLLEGGYYHTDTDELQNVRDRLGAVAAEDPEFVLKLARYARHEMNLRDIPIVLLVEAAHDTRTQPYVREYAPAIIRRADGLLKAKDYHDHYKSPAGERVAMPKPLRKGLRDTLFTLTRYEITKSHDRTLHRRSIRFSGHRAERMY